MSRIGIVAAAGRSARTRLGDYTTKAAFPLLGKPLLCHQIDFLLHRSGADRVIVVAQPRHARLLASLVPGEARSRVAFLYSESSGGWAGKVEQVGAFIAPDDEVAIVSCDNYQTAVSVEWLTADCDVKFTFTWKEGGTPSTDGPVFGCAGEEDGWEWGQRAGRDFHGFIFTGYIVARGEALLRGLARVPLSARGEKEITALLDVLQQVDGAIVDGFPYPGRYEDVSDLVELARIEARYSGHEAVGSVDLGAGVLLCDSENRVLLTERQDGRGWVPPGGLVDRGESFTHAAVRELAEETGVQVDPKVLRLLGVYPTIAKAGNAGCSVIFHARVPRGASVTVSASECRGYGWFDRDGAVRLAIPFNLDRAVRDYFDGRELDAR